MYCISLSDQKTYIPSSAITLNLPMDISLMCTTNKFCKINAEKPTLKLPISRLAFPVERFNIKLAIIPMHQQTRIAIFLPILSDVHPKVKVPSTPASSGRLYIRTRRCLFSQYRPNSAEIVSSNGVIILT